MNRPPLSSVWQTPSVRLPILSVFGFGLAAHAYKFLNLLPNYDSLGSLYSSQNTIHLGRCFLTLGCGISSYYDLSWVIGLLSLAYLALSALCVQALFGITSKPGLILSSGLLVTFPAVTNTFAFLFTADGYFLAMLLASLAVLLALTREKGWMAASVLLCLSLGMYQAYFLYAIVLTLLYAVKRLLFDCESVRLLLPRLLRVLLAGILGGLLYLASSRLLLFLEGASLSGYNGLSGISLHSLPSFADAVYDSLHDFLFFFFYSRRGLSFYLILNICFAAALAASGLGLLWKRRRQIGAAGVCLICAAAALLPFCVYLYYFVSGVDYHTIMLEDLALLYVFLLLFPEHLAWQKGKAALCRRGIYVLSALLLYNFILTANIAYTGMAHSFQRSLTVIGRMADRMEQLDGFSQADRLAVTGQLPDSRPTIYNYPPDLSGTVPFYVMRIPENYADMLRNYNNIDLTPVSEDELQKLTETPQYRSMRCWPEEGSVQVIGRCVVIRLPEAEKEEGGTLPWQAD